MILADQIKKVATEHGMTISEIAATLGVKQPQLSRTINNERISLKDLEAIAGAIGCKVGDFFRDEIEPELPRSSEMVLSIGDKKYDLLLLPRPAELDDPKLVKE